MIGWNSLRRELYTNGFFEKICTRKLNYEMTNERLKDLDKFRQNSIGKKYKIPFKKFIFNHQSTANLRGNKQIEVEDDRKFFCSELIAKAFKVLGVLKEDCYEKSSAKYFPGSFAEKWHGGFIDEDLAEDVALGPTLNVLASNQFYIPYDQQLNSLRN